MLRIAFTGAVKTNPDSGRALLLLQIRKPFLCLDGVFTFRVFPDDLGIQLFCMLSVILQLFKLGGLEDLFGTVS